MSATITPNQATLAPGQTQIFTASEAVDWSCSAGSITSSGHFTAPIAPRCPATGVMGPATCTITAVTKGASNIFLDTFFNFGTLIRFGGGNASQITVALAPQRLSLAESEIIVPAGGTYQFSPILTNYHSDSSLEWHLVPYDWRYDGTPLSPTLTLALRYTDAEVSTFGIGSINSAGLYTAPPVSPGFGVMAWVYCRENLNVFTNAIINVQG